MIGVIIASRKVGINPDNVATPIAASLGDLITLSLLAGISTALYKELGETERTHTHTPQLQSSFKSRHRVRNLHVRDTFYLVTFWSLETRLTC